MYQFVDVLCLAVPGVVHALDLNGALGFEVAKLDGLCHAPKVFYSAGVNVFGIHIRKLQNNIVTQLLEQFFAHAYPVSW